jgi:hypothetical protein
VATPLTLTILNTLGVGALATTGTPAALGTAARGTASTAARADHAHAHGNLGGGALHANATTSADGFMSSTDKTKLDSLPSGTAPEFGTLRVTSNVDASPTTTNHPFQVGPTSGTNVRIDGNEIMAVNDGAASILYLNHDGGAVYITGQMALHAANWGTYISDVTTSAKGLMTAADKLKLDGIEAGATAGGGGGGGVTLVTTGTPAAVGTASRGTSEFAARSDHVHAHGNQGGGALHANATTSADGFMSAADKSKLDGIEAGATAGGGGVALATTGTPAAVGTATRGTATTAARSDHVHAHGNQGGGTLHANATTSADGFMSSADKTKLNGVATGATANSTESVNAGTGTLARRDPSNGAIRAAVFAASTGASTVGGFTIGGRSLIDNGSGLAFNVAVSGPSFTPTSDLRLKYDLTSVGDQEALERILQIEVLEFNRIQDDVRARGFGAQGLREIDDLYVAGDEVIMDLILDEEGMPLLDEMDQPLLTTRLDENLDPVRTPLGVDTSAILADVVAALRAHEVALGLALNRIAALEAQLTPTP